MNDRANEQSTPTEGNAPPSHLHFPVVGIGASAGGLPALIRLFEHTLQARAWPSS